MDTELRRLLPGSEIVARSMAYALLAPSKRVRPVLTMLAVELCGGTAARAVPAAAAVEMVHVRRSSWTTCRRGTTRRSGAGGTKR